MIKKIIIGVIFIIVAAAAGRGVWAWQIVQTEERAKSALGDAIKNASSLQSFSFTATTTGKVVMKSVEAPSSLDSIKSLPTSFTFNVLSKGDMDLHSRENPSADMFLDMSIDTEKNATTSASLSLATHQILFEKSNYLNFSKFEIALTSTDPKLSGAQVIIGMINGFTASLKNKWIKADPSAIPAGVSSVSSIPQADVNAVFGDKRITDYLKGLSYLKSTTFVAKEQVMGHPVYHLSLVFQYEKQLFDVLRQVVMEKGTIPPAQIDAFNKNFDSFEKSFEGKSFTANIWVGQNDSFIYRILVSDFTFEDTVNKISITLTQDTTVYNQNKEFSITAPANATTLEEIIGSIFGASLNTARDKGSDAAIKANLANLRASAELYYDQKGGNSYGAMGNCSVSGTGAIKTISGSCSQNIMGDAGFIKMIKAAAVAAGSTGYVNVSLGGKAWAAFVPLKSSPKTWWCVDSKGSVKALPSAPVKTTTICS